MEVRHPVHPDHMVVFDTAEMREHFLIKDLFVENRPKLVYSFFDRLIVGGICPTQNLSLEVDPNVIGAAFLLQRRELGLINIGGTGKVTADGVEFALASGDGLYLGRGTRALEFNSAEADQPARFYLLSAPAHATLPSAIIPADQAVSVSLGDSATSNRRTINKYIHPAGVPSCQLVMGMTVLEPGSVWNTMPTHTHQRRMEAYFYFNMEADNLVFHMMGEPDETRHLVVRNEQAVVSPSWSIHSGVGTSAYSFIWGMAGENQDFDDMDHVEMVLLK